MLLLVVVLRISVAYAEVNSVGGVILPKLLERLGVEKVEKHYCDPTGDFKHNPEPLEKNLGDIMGLMAKGGYDVAFVFDPDVDRLAMICEDGKMYGVAWSVLQYIIGYCYQSIFFTVHLTVFAM